MNPLRFYMCGYSVHTQPMSSLGDRDGLSYYLFRLQTEGSCRALVDGKMTTIQAGDLMLYKPGDAYELQFVPLPDERGEMKLFSADYFLACTGDWVDDWWNRGPSKKQQERIRLDENLITLWRLLLVELSKHRMGEQNKELIDHLLHALCVSIERAILETSVMPGRSFSAARMKAYIEQHAMAPFKIEDVAHHVGLSVSRSVHLFKECFGISMKEYAKDIRLAAAIERIRYSKMPIEQIAEVSGFPSYSFFYKVFKDKHGISPLEYRKRAWEQTDMKTEPVLRERN